MRRALIITSFSFLFLAPAAKAEYDPIGGGTTKLALDKSFSSFLERNGISLTAKAPAKAKGKTFTLPISGGVFDPTIGMGSIDQEGTLFFQGDKGKVPLREIGVKTKASPLIAKVGGSQLKVASSSVRKAKREGFDSSYSAKQLKLSAKVATRLNKKLRPKNEFKAGQTIGSLLVKTQPQLVTIKEEGKATISIDPAFFAKLDSRFVSLNPLFPAERFGLEFSFPIAKGGAIAPNGAEGTLRSTGAIELLQLGAGQLFWKDSWLDLTTKQDTAEVDIEPTPAFPGKLGRVGVLDLGQTAFASDPKARTIATSGAPLTLQAQAAGQLNLAFAQGQAVFARGELVGVLGFAAVGE